jgi:transcriptional repressor NrdR
MRCPFCSADETRVIDSRLSEDGSSVRRRRECEVCSERFTTFERAELRLQVVKSMAGEVFSGGVACWHDPGTRERLDAAAVEKAIGRIRQKLLTSGEREVNSRAIGDWVMEELKELDPVAYVRYASVYRSFQDLDAFSDEVQRLQNEPAADVRDKQLKLIPDSDNGKS